MNGNIKQSESIQSAEHRETQSNATQLQLERLDDCRENKENISNWIMRFREYIK